MNHRKNLFYLFALLIVALAFPTFLLAQPEVPAGADTPLEAPDGFPPLEGGVPNPNPIISSAPVQPATPNAPAIEIWYGKTQTFGALGTPQVWINILGTVSGDPPVTALSYSLNNGPYKPLTIGPTKMRTYGAGDFNIELLYTDLVPTPGSNTVKIKASDGTSEVIETVTVNYMAGIVPPLPYTTNWSLPVQNSVQIVDGRWKVDGGKLENELPGYDRLVAIGDMSWKDYEVTVPVTVKSVNSSEWGPPSNGAGIGFIARWRGHTDTSPITQPREGWRQIGVMAWHRWAPNGNVGLEMRGHGGGEIASAVPNPPIEMNTEYIFKLSVQSSPTVGEAATYRFKYWRAGDPEPARWQMSAVGNAGEPATGSILLVTHQVEASYGNVTVKPLPSGPFTVTSTPPANGSIIIEPQKPTYEYGERVRIRAQGAAGFGLANWTGNFSGTDNPILLDVTQNVNFGAVFEPLEGKIKLNLTINGQGTVDRKPFKGEYLYGEEVTLTPKPAPGFIFAGWGTNGTGDLTGADNPAVIVMDETKSIVANFVPANPDSPVSDDFNACALNTGLWTFINPKGDGSFSVNGTQLRLSVPGNVSHNPWFPNQSVRVMQPTANSDLEIVTKFESEITQQYQMQGIIIEKDANNYLRFDTHHNGEGIVVYVARITNGVPHSMIFSPVLTQTPSYLRVTRHGSSWGFSYSDNGSGWTSAGSFVYTMAVAKTGVFAGNHTSGRPAPAHTAIVDYFFNTASPIDPEDGQNLDQLTINVTKVGQGTVTLSPDKPTYTCGEVVTLTAAADTGWIFQGWSGDLTGNTPSKQLTMTRDYNVTATFVESNEESFKIYLPLGLR